MQISLQGRPPRLTVQGEILREVEYFEAVLLGLQHSGRPLVAVDTAQAIARILRWEGVTPFGAGIFSVNSLRLIARHLVEENFAGFHMAVQLSTGPSFWEITASLMEALPAEEWIRILNSHQHRPDNPFSLIRYKDLDPWSEAEMKEKSTRDQVKAAFDLLRVVEVFADDGLLSQIATRRSALETAVQATAKVPK